MHNNIKGKIFINSNKNLKIEKYDYNNVDYFELIKTERDNGFKQVILTSEIMIKLISIYYHIRNFRIIKISFIEEDDALLEDIEYYLEELKKDRDNFKNLENWLEALNSDDSIDIKQVVIQGEAIDSKKEATLILNVNGTFITSCKYFKKESEYLKNSLTTLL